MKNKIAIILGGWLGDEGKGKATQHYLNKYKNDKGLLCIRSSGGTNTGATIYIDDTKINIHMLPVGAFHDDCHSYIGNACYVNLDILLSEIRQRSKLGMTGRVFLSRYAHVVTPEYLKEDKDKEEQQKFGSTKNGVSIAAARKYSYSGLQVRDVRLNADNKNERLHQLVIRERDANHLKNTIAELVAFGVEIVEPYSLFENIVVPRQWNIVVEGTQGVGLDINHGFDYPFVSAGSFTPYGLLDGIGYALAPSEVCMAIKTYGSYFGPKRMGVADFDNDLFRIFAGEFGTTTGRPRNLSWLDVRYLRRVASLVKPTAIMLNCIDLLDYFPTNGEVWSIIIDDDNRLDFDDRAIVNGKLTSAGALLVETIEEYAHAPVSLLGIGPKHNDIIER